MFRQFVFIGILSQTCLELNCERKCCIAACANKKHNHHCQANESNVFDTVSALVLEPVCVSRKSAWTHIAMKAMSLAWQKSCLLSPCWKMLSSACVHKHLPARAVLWCLPTPGAKRLNLKAGSAAQKKNMLDQNSGLPLQSLWNGNLHSFEEWKPGLDVVWNWRAAHPDESHHCFDFSTHNELQLQCELCLGQSGRAWEWVHLLSAAHPVGGLQGMAVTSIQSTAPQVLIISFLALWSVNCPVSCRGWQSRIDPKLNMQLAWRKACFASLTTVVVQLIFHDCLEWQVCSQGVPRCLQAMVWVCLWHACKHREFGSQIGANKLACQLFGSKTLTFLLSFGNENNMNLHCQKDHKFTGLWCRFVAFFKEFIQGCIMGTMKAVQTSTNTDNWSMVIFMGLICADCPQWFSWDWVVWSHHGCFHGTDLCRVSMLQHSPSTFHDDIFNDSQSVKLPSWQQQPNKRNSKLCSTITILSSDSTLQSSFLQKRQESKVLNSSESDASNHSSTNQFQCWQQTKLGGATILSLSRNWVSGLWCFRPNTKGWWWSGRPQLGSRLQWELSTRDWTWMGTWQSIPQALMLLMQGRQGCHNGHEVIWVQHRGRLLQSDSLKRHCSACQGDLLSSKNVQENLSFPHVKLDKSHERTVQLTHLCCSFF